MSALSRLLVLLLGLQVSGLQVPAACTRRAVLLPAAASLAYLRQSPARAADADKKFEKCLADCVYEATKIAKGGLGPASAARVHRRC